MIALHLWVCSPLSPLHFRWAMTAGSAQCKQWAQTDGLTSSLTHNQTDAQSPHVGYLPRVALTHLLAHLIKSKSTIKVMSRRTETLYGATQPIFAYSAQMDTITSTLMVTRWLKTLWASQTYSSKSFLSTTTLHVVLSQVLTPTQRLLDLHHGLIAIEASKAVNHKVRINGLNQSWRTLDELLKWGKKEWINKRKNSQLPRVERDKLAAKLLQAS